VYAGGFIQHYALMLRCASTELDWQLSAIQCLCIVLQLMRSIGDWGIDIFQVSELSNGRPLTVVGYSLFKVD